MGLWKEGHRPAEMGTLPPAQGSSCGQGRQGHKDVSVEDLASPCLPWLQQSFDGCKAITESRKPCRTQSQQCRGLTLPPPSPILPWQPSTSGCARCQAECQKPCLSSPADRALEKGGFFKT